MLGDVRFDVAPPAVPTGAGTIKDLTGLKTYITGPLNSSIAILLISDPFGYRVPNLWKIADKVATAGYLVVVPDFFYGDRPDLRDPSKFSWEAWFKRHTQEKGYEDAKQVIAALKAKGVRSIGVAGFCWGGSVLAKLASLNDIRAAVILHPLYITEDEIEAVKIPIAILGGEKDSHSRPERLKRFGEILSTKSQIESYVKIFPGVGHGFSVRYLLEDEPAVRSAEEAHRDMLEWFPEACQVNAKHQFEKVGCKTCTNNVACVIFETDIATLVQCLRSVLLGSRV